MVLRPTVADRNMHFEPADFVSTTIRILENAGIQKTVNATAPFSMGIVDITGFLTLKFLPICWRYLHLSNTMAGYFGTWFPYHFQCPFSLISLLPVIKRASKYLSLNQTSILASSPSGSNLVMMILASDV